MTLSITKTSFLTYTLYFYTLDIFVNTDLNLKSLEIFLVLLNYLPYPQFICKTYKFSLWNLWNNIYKIWYVNNVIKKVLLCFSLQYKGCFFRPVNIPPFVNIMIGWFYFRVFTNDCYETIIIHYSQKKTTTFHYILKCKIHNDKNLLCHKHFYNHKL